MTDMDFYKKILCKKKINKVLDKGGTVTVSAKVLSVFGDGSRSRAILCTKDGLRLVMMCKKWSYEFVENLKDVLKPGDVLDVDIYCRNLLEKTPADYMVTRLTLIENPWESVEDKVHEADLITCRVVSKWKEGFSARIEGLPGIVAFVAPTEDKGKRLKVGEYYTCKVVEVSGSYRTLKLNVIEECEPEMYDKRVCLAV